MVKKCKKLTLKIPEPRIVTLYEARLAAKGLDIADDTYDIGIYFDCARSWKEAKDGYDKFMLLLGCNILVKKYNPDWYTVCYISEFMWDNRDIFDPFFNENNREGYRPMDYKDLNPEKDSGFYEAYIQPFESLLSGGYSDEDYQTLYDAFVKKINSEKGGEKSKKS